MKIFKKFDSIIISPSGNFYGSEQVLHNFLSNTKRKYLVYLPSNSILHTKVKHLNNHEFLSFRSIQLLYLKVFLSLFFGSSKTLYINEGGHIKYAKIIAGILKSVRVILHIRLLEDCNSKRLGHIPNNLLLVSISDFISEHLGDYSYCKIYDPLDTKSVGVSDFKNKNSIFCIGIVGRVSWSKGLRFYNEFFEYISSKRIAKFVEFHFFGDIIKHDDKALSFHQKFHNGTDLKVFFDGYENDQEKLYSHLSMVLHLNPKEPLGRIGLESWARGIPFVCFNEGGAGEINRRLGMMNYSIISNENWMESLVGLIEKIVSGNTLADMERAKTGVEGVFSVSRYVSELEQLFKFH